MQTVPSLWDPGSSTSTTHRRVPRPRLATTGTVLSHVPTLVHSHNPPAGGVACHRTQYHKVRMSSQVSPGFSLYSQVMKNAEGTHKEKSCWVKQQMGLNIATTLLRTIHTPPHKPVNNAAVITLLLRCYNTHSRGVFTQQSGEVQVGHCNIVSQACRLSSSSCTKARSQ